MTDTSYEEESYDSNSYSTDEGYQLPSDLVSDVQPTKYVSVIYQQPIILFEEMGNRVPEFIRTAKYNEVPPFNGIPITDSCRMFINAFNTLSRNDIANPPQNIADYANYITSLIPQKAWFQIANAWPACIPRITNSTEPLIAALLKIASEVNDPINFLRFLSLTIFPKVFTSKRSAINSILVALSPCKLRKKDGFWAYIVRSPEKDQPDEFFLVTRDKKTKEMVIKAQGPVTRCDKSKDRISIIVKGESGRITDFTPLDPDVIPLWTSLYREEPANEEEEEEEEEDSEKPPKYVPFPYFLTTDYDDYIPDVAYAAFYEAITSNDGVFVRALLNISNVPYDAAEALLTLSLHTKKVTSVFGQIVGALLQDERTNPMEIYSRSSNTFYRKFIHALFERFAAPYLTDFLRKVVVLIDQSEESKEGDDAQPGVTEKTFFSVVKYITMSSQYIPPAIRHFASVLRSYSIAKFNSRGFTFLLMGGFFGLDFICPVLAKAAKYFPDIEIKHPDTVRQVSDMLQYIFHGALLPEPYTAWNHRIKKHTIPLVEEFVFSVGDLANDLPLYPSPPQEQIAPAIDHIMHAILQRPERLRQAFDEATVPQPTYTPQVGWNFSVSIGDFFRQYYDRGQRRPNIKQAKRVRPKDLMFPKLPMYGMVTTKKAGLNGSVASASDAASAVSLPLTFKERNLTVPSAHSIRLPLKPRNTAHNPLAKPERSQDDSDESSLSEHPPKKRGLPLQDFTPPPAPPEIKKRRLMPMNYSATETITEDTTDDQPDPELNKGMEPPPFADEDEHKGGKNRRKKKVTNRIVIKSSGLAASKEELVKEEVFRVNNDTAGGIVTKIRTIRGQKARGTDSI